MWQTQNNKLNPGSQYIPIYPNIIINGQTHPPTVAAWSPTLPPPSYPRSAARLSSAWPSAPSAPQRDRRCGHGHWWGWRRCTRLAPSLLAWVEVTGHAPYGQGCQGEKSAQRRWIRPSSTCPNYGDGDYGNLRHGIGTTALRSNPRDLRIPNAHQNASRKIKFMKYHESLY